MRGTVENSDSRLPREVKGLEFWLGEKFSLEKLDAVIEVFGLWLATGGPTIAAFEPLPCESSLNLLALSAISLLSLSSVSLRFSLRRKSTHRSAKDW